MNPGGENGPLTPALSPPAATARQRGESEGERENRPQSVSHREAQGFKARQLCFRGSLSPSLSSIRRRRAGRDYVGQGGGEAGVLLWRILFSLRLPDQAFWLASLASSIRSQNFGFCWRASSSCTFKPERNRKSFSVCRLRIRCTNKPN